MFIRLRRHLTYANVVSSLCLFIVLGGGTAYAAVTITGKNVKNGSLTGTDIKDNSLTGTDVKSLTSRDFKGGALSAGPRGATGPQGPQGVPGQNGADGSVRAYATVQDGALVPERSKGVLGMSPGCTSSGACSPPAAGQGSTTNYCFRLAFAPDNVEVTPLKKQFSSAHEASGVAALAPAITNGVSVTGCPTGFTSAQITATDENSSSSVVAGFYATFN